MSFDQDVRMMLQQRAEGVAAAPVLPDSTVRRTRVRKALMAGGMAVAVAAVAVAGAFIRSAIWTDAAPLPPADEAEEEVEQIATIRRLIDAINDRDADAFTAAFPKGGYFEMAERGLFNSRVDFLGRSVPHQNYLSVADTQLVESWMALNDEWGLEAQLITCSPKVEDDVGSVHCEVATKWHTLSLEVTERWDLQFRGTKVLEFDYALLDLNPREHTLPLGYDGLEAWEAWLEANYPEDAARYLNPRVLAPPSDEVQPFWDRFGPRLAPLYWIMETDWVINGHRFNPNGFIPYNPAFVDEIEASIQEYLDGR